MAHVETYLVHPDGSPAQFRVEINRKDQNSAFGLDFPSLCLVVSLTDPGRHPQFRSAWQQQRSQISKYGRFKLRFSSECSGNQVHAYRSKDNQRAHYRACTGRFIECEPNPERR